VKPNEVEGDEGFKRDLHVAIGLQLRCHPEELLAVTPASSEGEEELRSGLGAEAFDGSGV